MRKKEMTDRQLADREELIGKLIASGWSQRDQGDWFEHGLWADREATLEFENKTLQIRMSLSSEQRMIFVSLEDPHGRTISFGLSYEDRLTEVLDAVVAIQDRVSPDNYQENLDTLVRGCPAVYAFVGQDRVRITLNQEDLTLDQPNSESVPRELIDCVGDLVRSAGWESQDPESAIPSQVSQPLDFHARYTNAHLELGLGVVLAENLLVLSMTQGDGKQLPGLRLYPRTNMQSVIGVIAGYQKNLNRDDYPDLVEALIPVCRLVLIESDQGLIKASR